MRAHDNIVIFFTNGQDIVLPLMCTPSGHGNLEPRTWLSRPHNDTRPASKRWLSRDWKLPPLSIISYHRSTAMTDCLSTLYGESDTPPNMQCCFSLVKSHSFDQAVTLACLIGCACSLVMVHHAMLIDLLRLRGEVGTIRYRHVHGAAFQLDTPCTVS